jgi:hypothetical protein
MSEQNNSVPCIAESVEADFERGTWTFEPVGDFVVGAGRYVIQSEANYVELTKALGFMLRGIEGGHIKCAPYFDFDPEAAQIEFKSPADLIRGVLAKAGVPA